MHKKSKGEKPWEPSTKAFDFDVPMFFGMKPQNDDMLSSEFLLLRLHVFEQWCIT